MVGWWREGRLKVGWRWWFGVVGCCIIGMQPNLIKRWDCLEYEWMNSWSLVCPNKCSYVHQSPCSLEFVRRVLTVSKIGLRYYVFFHAIPLLLRLRKAKTHQDRLNTLLRTLYQYFKSIMFMGFLVGLTKGALCVKNNLSLPLDGKFMVVQTFLSGASIFWEERSRQREIGYFVLAKAIRSVYVMVKRRGWLWVSGEAVGLHVVLMAVLSYIFHQQPALLKYKETFEISWGKD